MFWTYSKWEMSMRKLKGVWNRHERKSEKKLIGIINIKIQRNGEWPDSVQDINGRRVKEE
jgi:hypothetical protein